jgi:hypothetical protein
VRTKILCRASVVLAILSASSHASARPADRWLVVPVITAPTQAPALSPRSLFLPFEAQLGRERAVDANENAVVRFEAEHSSEPVRVSDAQMKQLLQNVGEGARSLGFGKRKEAQEELAPIESLSAPMRDYFKRESQHAQLLFDACTYTAYLLVRDKQPEQGDSQMERCVRAFPGYEPHQQLVRKMFQRARESVSREPHGSIVIEGGANDCTTRINGIETSKNSIVDIATGARRVQLECGADKPGRIHVVMVHEGENHIVIDPRFDAAVHSDGALWLSYSDDAARNAHLRDDADTLEKILGSHVALLVVERSSYGSLSVHVGTSTRRDVSLLPFASGTGYRAPDVQAAVQMLLSTAPATAMPGERPRHPVLIQARLEPELDPRPARHTTEMNLGVRLGLGLSLGVVGVAGLSVSWGMYAKRLSLRTHSYVGQIDRGTLHQFDDAATWLGGAGAIGDAFIIGAESFLLPEAQDTVPTAAWIVGGAGAALALTGVGFAVFGEHCRPRLATALAPCTGFAADSTFGPLLVLHAIPFLSAPITYALREWLTPRRMEIGFDGRMLAVAGSF